MVVYYTGTGNSRYVAQRFAAALGDDLITANESIKNDTPAALHSDRPWVFVSPTYGWQIPHIFADFLRRGSFTGSRLLPPSTPCLSLRRFRPYLKAHCAYSAARLNISPNYPP